MGFLSEIQKDLVDGKSPIGPVMLRIRLLAAKLGSSDLEEWVKHEAEGYPENFDIPPYRKIAVSFSGTFSGPFGSGIRNAPIAPYLIAQFASESWRYLNLRESAAGVESLLADSNGLHLDYSNLILLLQGKIYPDYACNQVKGYVSQSAIAEVANAIRNRMLELTIQLEKRIPGIGSVELDGFNNNPAIASQVFHQTVYGGMTNINSSGQNANIQLSIVTGSKESLLNELSNAGLDDRATEELAELIAEEKSNDPAQPLGKRTRKWLGERITKGFDSGVSGGLAALTKIAQEAAMQYWGLK